MNFVTTRTRITLGLVCMVVSILLAATMLGILPDRTPEVLDGRATLCEALAVNGSVLVTRNDLDRLELILRTVVSRKENVLSAAIRRADGTLLVEVGDHCRHWRLLASDHSTDSQVQVPIRERNRRKWGTVEMRFVPLNPPGWLGVFQDPQIRLVAFVGSAAYVLMFLYLCRMLRQLDPTQAVPGHVRSAFDTLVESVIVLDTRERIVLTNQAFASVLGQSPQRLLGRRASGLPWRQEDEDNTPEEYPWERVLRESTTSSNTLLKLRSAKGDVRTFLVNCSPVPAQGGPVQGVLVGLDDVTRLEAQEIELRKAKAEAEAANRAKSEFLANMSHEIRTPMNAVLGFADVLRRGLANSDEERQEYLDTIHSSGTFLLELINDILDLSKIESGRLEVECTTCSPHQVISDVVEVLGVRAREKGLKLEYKTDTPIPQTIQSDPTRLRQILTNLVGNALKFTNEGGITVVARLLTDGPSPQLGIDVVDTGIGIAPEKLNAIFDPFTQADASITRQFGGTGLGLAISRRFAKALGGDLTATSRPGQGSTFTVTLDTGPLAGVPLLEGEQLTQQRKQEARPVKPASDTLPPGRVLVVDDGESNRQLIQLVLERAGAVVETATNGAEAVQCVADGPVDMILMDMQMPVMDGYTASRRLRDTGFKKPIIALTANAMAGDEEKCRAAGCSGFLPKPVNIDALLQTVARELSAAGGSTDRVNQAGDSTRASVADHPPAPSVPPPAVGQNETESHSPAARPPAPARDTRHADPTGSAPALDAADAEEEQQLLEVFRTQLQGDLDGMGRAWEAGDFAELAGRAHSIKGCGGTFGYDELSSRAAQLEQSAKQRNVREAKAALAELKTLAAAILGPTLGAGLRPRRGGDRRSQGSKREPQPNTATRSGDRPERGPDTRSTTRDTPAKPAPSRPDAPAGGPKTGPTRKLPPVRSSLPMDDPVFYKIVCDFVPRLDEQLAAMEDAWRRTDWQELAGLAHWLKGAGGTVGFDCFTAPARCLEQQAKQQSGDVEALLKQLRELSNAIDVRQSAAVTEMASQSGAAGA